MYITIYLHTKFNTHNSIGSLVILNKQKIWIQNRHSHVFILHTTKLWFQQKLSMFLISTTIPNLRTLQNAASGAITDLACRVKPLSGDNLSTMATYHHVYHN